MTEVRSLRFPIHLFDAAPAAERVLQAMAWSYVARQCYHHSFLNRDILPHVPAIKEGPLVDMTDAPAFEDLRFRFFATAEGLIESIPPKPVAQNCAVATLRELSRGCGR